jgi:hypothetical protein
MMQEVDDVETEFYRALGKDMLTEAFFDLQLNTREFLDKIPAGNICARAAAGIRRRVSNESAQQHQGSFSTGNQIRNNVCSSRASSNVEDKSCAAVIVATECSVASDPDGMF